MTSATDLSSLISRLEAAKEGSRALDEAIVRTLCPRAIVDFYIVGDDEKTVFHGDELGLNKVDVPHYSESIDAAMTLVPEMQWGMSWDIEGVHGGICAYVWLEHPTNEGSFCRSEPMQSYAEANKQLPRLICIAALKARAAASGDNG